MVRVWNPVAHSPDPNRLACKDLQETEPRQLREDELLERAARDLDPEVPEARDLDGLGQRRIRLQRRGRREVCPPFFGLSEELRPVRGRAVFQASCELPSAEEAFVL